MTALPGSKAIFVTLPATSAATVTPCTAVSVPTEPSDVSHESLLTTAVVTVSGGGTNFLPLAIIDLICRALIPARTAITQDNAEDGEKNPFLHMITLHPSGNVPPGAAALAEAAEELQRSTV